MPSTLPPIPAPDLVESAPRHLVGVSAQMTRATDQTPMLWRSFMPRRNELTGRQGGHFVSMTVYDLADGAPLTPATPYTKWAAAEVSEGSPIPAGMAAYTIPSGLYAVFTYRGTAAAFGPVAGYIFGTWLPQSGYVLDARPQFDLLPPGYRPDDPAAEETIWVPIRPA